MAESAAQVFARLGAREPLGDLGLPFLTPLNNGTGLRPGDTVEVLGDEGSGKSELLLNIVAHCVLPKRWKGVWLGGRGVQVVFISTDYKLDLLRLEAVMEGQLSCMVEREIVDSASQQLDSTKQLLSTALSGIHVLHCHSSHQLTVTLFSLQQLLHTHPEVCAIMLDNAGAFYWIDRAEAGQYQERASGTTWVKVLRKLVVDHQLVLCAARPVLLPRRSEQVGTDMLLGSSWQQMMKYTFTTRKITSILATARGGGGGRGMPADHELFQVQQVSPSGQCYRFRITDTGIEFLH